MYTERKAIEEEMHFNRKMIHEFRDRNVALLKSLRELDERDMSDTVSYDMLNSLTGQLSEAIGNIAQIVPKVSVSEVIKHHSNDVNKDQIIKEEVKEVRNEIVAKEEELKKDGRMKPEQLSKERTASIVLQIVENKGQAKTKEIEKEFFRLTGRRYANFYDILKNALRLFPNKLEKRSGGLYLYKG